jgi:hypothetical protein
MITDDAIRERHGVACRQQNNDTESQITVNEGEKYVHLNGNSYTRQLTQWQARYLAAKLYRLARRIRQRSEAS